MLELRQYQVKALDAIFAALQEQDNVLFQAVMGAGKTAMTTRLVRHFYHNYPAMRFLVLMHKQELVEQFSKSFEQFTDIPAISIGIACGGLKQWDTEKRITVASVQTLVNRLGEFPGADLIVIDEAHRVDINGDSQYRKVINTLRDYKPNCRILGLTATPARLGHGYIYGDKCKPGSVNLFPNLSHKITYAELVAQNYLMPLRGKVCVNEELAAELSGVKKQGDYVLDQLGDVMVRPRHLSTAVDGLKQHGDGYRHVVAFCCTISHAETLRDKLIESGETATVIHSKLTPIERAANLASWEAGECRIICGVNILSEGYDFPPADCILMARPTLSTTLYLQTVGRIVRIHPGKEKALLIDLTTNTERFGTDLDNLKVTIPKGDGEGGGETPAKICPKCDTVVHPLLRFCPSCNFEWEIVEVEAAEPTTKDVTFEPKIEMEWFKVGDIEYTLHHGKSGIPLLRVIYDCGGGFYRPLRFSDWVCLEHEGFARRKAETWWAIRSTDLAPDSVDEALFVSGELERPLGVLVDRSGKYPEIKGYDFTGEHVGLPF